MEKIIKIKDPVGLHARPAAILVKICKEYDSNVKIVFGEKEANLKSIISVMALGIKKNDEIKLIVEGEDDKKAMDSLIKEMTEQKII